MAWEGLQAHFVDATRQEPSPFGDDAVEWDYSRYARALGLTGVPGMADYRHTGGVVVPARPARWDAIRADYEEWARGAGWSVLRLSAKPSVMVPDPMVHALGVGIAGPDSLIFVRSGAGVRPTPGRRERPAGLSIPLTPAERWLIATDRVRRRARDEIAMRGIVLFVEEAHKLTAAGMNLLGHLLDAHRAWKARMLSRDAKAYVVLATTIEHEPEVAAMLKRHQLSVQIAPADPVADGKARPGASLDVEEEHLVAALAAAPLVPTERDIRRIFGFSGVQRVRDLAERGVLGRREAGGRPCYTVRPSHLENLPAVEPRVLEALLECYRQRLRRRIGHEHLLPAMAWLAFELGQPLRGAALFGRTSPANDATVSMDLLARLDHHLEKHADVLHCSHYATWMAMTAHQRGYDRAQKLAKELTERGLRSTRDLYRTTIHILCAGRTHLDRCLPDGFWPGLNSARIDGSLLDAVCILADLFARMRLMSLTEIRERHVVVEECCSGSLSTAQEQRPCNDALRTIIDVMRLRVELFLLERAGPQNSTQTCADAAPRGWIRNKRSPGYFSGGLLFAGIICSHYPDVNTGDQSTALDLVRTTGNPHDARILLAGCFKILFRHSSTLLLRQLADEITLLLPDEAPQELRRRVCLNLQCMAGRRTWLVSASNLLFGGNTGATYESVALSRALVEKGDFSGARESLRTALGAKFESPYPLALVIQTQVLLARRTLAWSDLEVTSALMERWRPVLPRILVAHLREFTRGSEFLCKGLLVEAAHEFRNSRLVLGEPAPGEARTLWSTALVSELMTRGLGRIADTLDERPRRALDVIADLVASSSQSPLVSFASHSAGLAILEYLVVGLELWARRRRPLDKEQTVTAALCLRTLAERALRSAGDDLVTALARNAKHFFAALSEAVSERVGYILEGAPSTRAVNSALDLLSEVWRLSPNRDDTRALERLATDAGDTLVFGRWAPSRSAKAHVSRWKEDAATYAKVREQCHPGKPSGGTHRFRVFGYLGTASEEPKQVAFRLRTTVKASGVYATVVPVASQPRKGRPSKRNQVSPKSKRGNRTIHDSFLGSSTAAAEVRRQQSIAARCDYPVLILGETGVGKELVARGVHAASRRAAGTLVVADCAATTQSLLESELFGHEKGAFTGASSRHSGFFARANKSSLFLDEVDSMSPRMQAALLRALETKEYKPLGAERYVRSDFRLLSAAFPGLLRSVDAGAFREDLYYRMSVLCIQIPPLREREGDSVELAISFASELGRVLTAGALREIERYEWPGNVRQLRHCLEVASVGHSDKLIGETAVADAIGVYARSREQQQWTKTATDGAWLRAYEHLRGLDGFTAAEFAESANTSRRSAQRHLAGLLAQRRIVRLGAGRATRYRLAEDA